MWLIFPARLASGWWGWGEPTRNNMKNRKLLVFIVDDNEYTLQQLKRSLHNSMPCNVLVFTRAVDCLNSLDREPDFILSDCNLAEESVYSMDGEHLLQLVKQRHPEIPVIMYSSKKDSEMAARLIRKGALDFINSDRVSPARGFAKRISERLKLELERMERNNSDRFRFAAICSICVLFIFSVFLLLKYAPENLPYAIILFMAITGLLVFWRRSVPGERNNTFR